MPTSVARTDARPRLRFDVKLNERMAADFEALAASEEGGNRAAVFKSALAAYKLIKEAQAHGAQVLIREEGRPDRELVGL